MTEELDRRLRWTTNAWIALILATFVLITQQRFFWIWDAHRIYVAGITRIEAVATFDWPFTCTLLLVQCLGLALVVSRAKGRAGIAAFLATVVASGLFTLALWLAPPLGGSQLAFLVGVESPLQLSQGMQNTFEPWQKSALMIQLLLDPSFGIGLALGFATFGLALWCTFRAFSDVRRMRSKRRGFDVT